MKTKKNVTVVLDESLAQLIRVEAAKSKKSVSSFLADFLADHFQNEAPYQKSMEAFLGAGPYLDSQGKPYPKRDELYE